MPWVESSGIIISIGGLNCFGVRGAAALERSEPSTRARRERGRARGCRARGCGARGCGARGGRAGGG